MSRSKVITSNEPWTMIGGQKVLVEDVKNYFVEQPAVTFSPERNKEIVCPCIFHRGEVELQGHCLCGLFNRK